MRAIKTNFVCEKRYVPLQIWLHNEIYINAYTHAQTMG